MASPSSAAAAAASAASTAAAAALATPTSKTVRAAALRSAALRSAALASDRASEVMGRAGVGGPFQRTRFRVRSAGGRGVGVRVGRDGAMGGGFGAASSSGASASSSAALGSMGGSREAGAGFGDEGSEGVPDGIQGSRDGHDNHSHGYEDAHAAEEETGSLARRSRAARFGTKRIGEVVVPKMMRWAVQEMINVSNKHALRQDFLRVKEQASDRPEAPAGAVTSHLGQKLPPARLALTHLAVSSPARFAVLYNVLLEVRKRLELALPPSRRSGGGDGEDDEEGQVQGWSPVKVIEWNCAAAEGLWAAAEAFNDIEDSATPNALEDGQEADEPTTGPTTRRRFAGPLRAYEGYDDRIPLLRAGMEITAWAQSQDRNLGAEQTSTVVRHRDEDDQDDVDEAVDEDDDVQDELEEEPNEEQEVEMPPWVQHASLEAITASFRSAAKREPILPARTSPFQLQRPGSREEAEELANLDGGQMLALSSFALSELPTDRDRQEHVRRMWKSGAEVIVIVDHATRRGFASVASARAFLLELGESTYARPAGSSVDKEIEVDENAERLVIGDHVFIADGAKATQLTEEEVQAMDDKREPIGAHVVAPCPHDRPCPLLHPFKPLEAHLQKMASPPSASGLPVCSFSQRVQVPAYLRKTKHSKRGAEDVQYSYVVVRRGRRPLIDPVSPAQRAAMGDDTTKKVLPTSLVAQGGASSETFVDISESSTRNASEALRRGASRTKTGILDALRTGEPIEPLRTLEEMPAEEDPDDGDGVASEAQAAESQEELLRMLPEVMAAELEREGATLSEEDKAARIAEAMEAVMAGRGTGATNAKSSKAKGQAIEDPVSPASTSSFLFDDDVDVEETEAEVEDPAADEAAMRLESYEWPRLIRPPLKKGGHVTFDACCASGAIERFTIPKSAGKQAYQDARKSAWGDIFPHPPKNGKTSIRVPAASDEFADPIRAEDKEGYIPEHFDNLFELFATKSQLKQRALKGIDQELGDVDHAAATASRKQKRVLRPSQAIGADVVAPTAMQDRRAQKARENKEARRPRRTKHRQALADTAAYGGSENARPPGMSSLRGYSTWVGLGAMSGRRLFSTSMRHGQPRDNNKASGRITDKDEERHRTQYNYDIFSAQPAEELTQFPLVSARELAKSSTRPRQVRMLARDFIDDSLYNPHYGYFSRQAVLLPDHEKLVAASDGTGAIADGFAFEQFRNERQFMRHVEERYRHFEARFEDEGEGKAATKATKTASPPSTPASDARRVKKAVAGAPAMSSAAGLDVAKTIGRAWKEQQEHKNIQERDILAMAARQVWHTPTELFKPHYAHAIARYIVAEYKLHNYPYDDLVIYELGAGSGALANDVLGYLAAEEPEIYTRTRYNIVEISARLAAQQRQKLDRHFAAGRVVINHGSFLDWDTPVSEPAFVIALEVLDNLSHDVIRYSTSTLEPYQAVVSIDETNDMHELWQPVTDPLIARYLDVLDEVRPGQGPAPASHLRHLPAGLRKTLTESMPFYPNLTRPHFIPTGQLRFLEVLRDMFPRHRLVVSDFDHLPDAIEGVDAPVVQTRYRGTMVPVTTYCVLQGYFDIFFPTDFELMRDVYGAVMDSRAGSPFRLDRPFGSGRWSAQAAAAQRSDSPAPSSTSTSSVKPTPMPMLVPSSSSPLGGGFFFSSGMGAEAAHAHHEAFSRRRLGRRPQLYSHAGFLERYAEVERTRLRDGSNPMVGWYANASFFLS